MAEGFFNRCAPPGYLAVSAGTKPADPINPLAVQAMNEVGIDISRQKSKTITDNMIKGSIKAVNIGCMDSSECPPLFLANPVDWAIDDSRGKPMERVREVRDEIERRVNDLAENLA